MASNEDEGRGAAKAFSKIADKAVDAVGDALSSLGEGSVHLYYEEFNLNVFKEHLDQLVKNQSVVNAIDLKEIFGKKVLMSPMIHAMLCVCPLAQQNGCTWVVCAPPDQGKTITAQFLMHGNHNMRPKRSLKIDALRFENFPKDFANHMKCPAAESEMALHLVNALNDTADLAAEGGGNVAKATATATGLAQKYLCNPEKKPIAFSSVMEMQDADATEYADILRFELENDEPAPILIIDEFNVNSEENAKFADELLVNAASARVLVFLMTRDEAWASKLITLNGGVKCKPLPRSVDNEGYDGTQTFRETPKWNSMYWPVAKLRELVGPFCDKNNIDVTKVIPDGTKCTPAEALKIVFQLKIKAETKPYPKV